jgi:hypothetical protein
MESSLSSAIETLVDNRKQMTPASLQQQLLALQPQVEREQALAAEFEAGVQNKHVLANKELQSSIHLAMDSGDAVENSKLFREENRRNNLMQQEVERAQAHSSIAHALAGKLNLLTGTMTASGSAQNESFVGDDASLAAEYAHVQQLYSELNAARSR